jgi:acetoin utilization deacetylase AcuC-like enzyme
MTLFFHPDYLAAAHAFATTRKPGWVRDDLVKRPIPGLRWREPDSSTFTQLTAAHDPAYVTAVRTGVPFKLASGSGFPWDPGIWAATRRSTGGVIAAALEAWGDRRHAGSLSSGLHHARRARGAGFCTFNGLAVAALTVLSLGAKRVLILDLDAHGGGGTHDILGADPRVVHVDISTCDFDRHPADSPSTWDYVADAANYLPTLTARLAEAAGAGPFDLCLYNAGVDCHENDQGGGIPSMSAEILRRREELVFAWANARRVPVAFVLAGGYPSDEHPQETVVALHRQTIEAAAVAADLNTHRRV